MNARDPMGRHTVAPITVIGIGNPYRHDDAAGQVVLAALQTRFAGDARVRLVELDGEPVRMIQSWEGSTRVFIVDAVRSGHEPGTIHRCQADHLTGVAADGVTLGGGHLLGLGEAIDLARALHHLPPALEVLGIEGACFEMGEGLTDAVASACRIVAARLMTEIDRVLAAR
ncbi:unannotated protein [freshwater metagenome]|uniref:Unannotated protein n=1 Tax=freshwater metagenome TaxID=449393 RepID=A0A6J7EH85_9ZZZZ|nr:hydrogenase maturation protease [Actinomycetota bacterium]